MLDAFHAQPSFKSLICDPLTTAEIDAHPDCDRTWATITAAREEAEKYIEEKRGEISQLCDAAREEMQEHNVRKIQSWSRSVSNNFQKKFPDQGGLDAVQWLRHQIADAASEL